MASDLLHALRDDAGPNREFGGIEPQLIAARDKLSSEGILAISFDGTLICANAALTDTWGLSRSLIENRNGDAVLVAMADQVADRDHYIDWMTSLRRNPTEQSREEILLTDGRVLDQRSMPIAGAANTQAARVWLFRDVTQLKKAAQNVQQMTAKWRAVTEQDLVGLCVVLRDGSVAFANSQFASLLGQHAEVITGQKLLRFLPPQERERVAARLQARTAGARGVSTFSTTVIHGDGSLVDVMVNAAPIRYLGQDATLACTVDVSELHQVERDLHFANLIIEQSRVVMFQAEAKEGLPRSYISRNVSRFGYTAEEAKAGAFRFPDFVHSDDRPAAQAALQDMIEGRSDVFEQEYRAITRDGSVRWIHDRTVAVRDEAGAVQAYRGTLIDVTERAEAEHKLRRTNRALRTLSSANAVLIHAGCESELLHDMCRVLAEVGGYALAWIGFAENDARKTVRPVASHGRHRESIEEFGITWDEFASGSGPTGRAIRTGTPQVNRSFADEPAMTGWRLPCLERGYGSSAALPLQQHAVTFGALVLVSAETNAFDAEELALLEELAQQLSYGIAALRLRAEHDRLHRRLQGSMNDTVQALASMLEFRDPYTAGHQRNVARMSGDIARLMGLPDSEVEGIVLAAALHDIGKINIPSEIVSKPGRLTALEMQMMQTHVTSGYDILKGIDFPWPVAEMVLQHHERLDGSGYPNNLRGDSILLGAKIIAVADVMESMMTHRPYRPALGPDAALTELERGRDTLYHPAAVDACVRMVHKGELPITVPSLDGDRAEKSAIRIEAAIPTMTQTARAAAPHLTPQQSAVIELLAQGRSIKEIARHLKLGIGTVKTHLSLAYASLGARNRMEAVLRAGFLLDRTAVESSGPMN